MIFAMKKTRIVPYAWLIALSLGLVCAASARADTLGDELQQLKSYEFGQDQDAMKAVEAEVDSARGNPAQRQEIAHRLAEFLTTDATYAAKQFVCRQLVLIADEREVPILETLLADDHLSHMALYALMPIPGTAASRALCEALTRTSGLDRIGVITALGERHDPEAVVPLGALLAADDAATAESAAAALSRIGTVPAAKALVAAWHRAREPRKTVFARDCLACADHLRAADNRKEAEKLYKALYKKKGDPVVRSGALRGLALIRGDRGWSLALDALDRGDRPAQRTAAALLLELPGPVPISLLERRASRISPQGQIYLLSVLTERGAKSALGVANKLVAAKDTGVRLAALRALGPLGDVSSLGVLEHYAVTGTRDEQDAARASLRRVSGPGVDETMIRALDTAPAAERLELVQALGDRGTREAVNTMLSIARSGEPAVSKAAWEALQKLSEPAQLPRLVDLMLALDPNQRDAAVQTVAAVAREAATETEQTSFVVARLRQATRLEDRISLLQVLGGIGGSEALTTLRQAMAGGPAEIELTAVRILAGWPNDAPMQDLLQKARHADDARVRTIALRGFLNQLGLATSLTPDQLTGFYQEAMGLATDDAGRRAVLSGLGNVRTTAALELAASKLDDAGVRREAATAVVQLGRSLCGAYPDSIRARLQQVITLLPSDDVADQAREVLKQMDRFGDYLVAWEFSPAYTKSGAGAKRLFGIVFAPEKPGSPGVPWQVLPASTDAKQPWLLDLGSALGGDDRVAYLRTRLHSDRDQTLMLELGSDDGVKAWLNGKVIKADNAVRGIEPAQDKVQVHLREGWNQLLLKITQQNAGWGACARLTNPDGSAAQGVRAAVEEN